MGQSGGGIWVTQGVYGSPRGYLGNSGGDVDHLRGIEATQGV